MNKMFTKFIVSSFIFVIAFSFCVAPAMAQPELGLNYATNLGLASQNGDVRDTATGPGRVLIAARSSLASPGGARTPPSIAVSHSLVAELGLGCSIYALGACPALATRPTFIEARQRVAVSRQHS